MLVNGDITKTKELYKMNANEFLYWAAFTIEKKNIEIENLNKNNEF